MSKGECHLCRFSCKDFLSNCQFFKPDRRKRTRESEINLKLFWKTIYTYTTKSELWG
jgi:hypothetical protein